MECLRRAGGAGDQWRAGRYMQKYAMQICVKHALMYLIFQTFNPSNERMISFIVSFFKNKCVH